MPVTVIERHAVGAGATGASAGNVQPGVMGGIVDAQGVLGTLGAQSLQLHRRFLPAIKESSGLDPLDHEVQYFYAALEAQEVTETQQFTAALQAHRLRAEWIDGRCPRLNRAWPHILGGALHQDCFQMDAYRFVSACPRHSATVRSSSMAKWSACSGLASGSLACYQGRLHHYVRDPGTGHGRLDRCGPGTVVGSRCADWSVSPPEAARPPSRSYATLRRALGDVNMVARRDGVMHVGSKHDPTGFEAHPTDMGRHWLLERFQTVFPNLAAEVVEARAGLGAETPDRTPYRWSIAGIRRCLCVCTQHEWLSVIRRDG